MNNNETVTVQLEKERTENLKCNRSSEKYEIQWRKVEKRKKFFDNLIVLNSHIQSRMESYTRWAQPWTQTHLYCPLKDQMTKSEIILVTGTVV